VAVNAILAFRRKRTIREERCVLEPMAEFTEDGVHARPVRRWMAEPEKLALDQELQRLIEQAIGRLPVTYRDVYILADVEGLPNPEIADMLQLSLPAVKSRLHRARLLMRNALAPYFEEESACSVAGT
jgi:RNA polymerase sigma-70 factor (ECF subfamily)